MTASINGSAVSILPRARDFGVIVACHDLVCAIAVRWVSRLALPEDVVLPNGSALLEAGAERWVAWDLGKRLGLPPLRDAWVLLRVPHEGEMVPLALRTGRCLAVQPLCERIALPTALEGPLAPAISGAFVADATHGGAIYGVELDVPRLWTDRELSASAALVKRGGTR